MNRRLSVEKRFIPNENNYGNVAWTKGEGFMITSLDVLESGGKIVVNMELTGYVKGTTGSEAVLTDEKQWFTLDLEKAKAYELMAGLESAIQEHQHQWIDDAVTNND